jgi:hypothetical protein
MGDSCSWIRIQEPTENKELRVNKFWEKIYKYDKYWPNNSGTNGATALKIFYYFPVFFKLRGQNLI